MLDVEKFTEILEKPLDKGMTFKPHDVNLTRFFPTPMEEKEPEEILTLSPEAAISVEKIDPTFPTG